MSTTLHNECLTFSNDPSQGVFPENRAEVKKEKSITILNPEELALQESSGLKYTAKKVAYYVSQAILGFTVFTLSLVFNTLTLGIPKIYNYHCVQSLKNKLEKQRLAVMQTALYAPLRGRNGRSVKIRQCTWERLKNSIKDDLKDNNVRDEVVDSFANQIQKIRNDLYNGGDTEELFGQIDKALGSKVYQKLKDTDNPAVEFLQILCMKYFGGNQGVKEDIFEKFSRERVGSLAGRGDCVLADGTTGFTLGKLGSIMDEHAGDATAFQRNSILSDIFWAALHPINFLQTKKSFWFPLEFNCHENNLCNYGYKLSDQPQNKELIFYYGPGPTGNRLSKGYLDYMQKKDIFEFRQNHQSVDEGAEKARSVEIKRHENLYKKPRDGSNSALRYLSASTDTHGTKRPDTRFKDAEEFMGRLKTRIVGSDGRMVCRHMTKGPGTEGIYVGEEVLPDEAVRGAIQTAQNIFTQLSLKNRFWEGLMESEKGKKRLACMMTLGTRAMIGLGGICKSLKDSPVLDLTQDNDLKASRATNACKQDIDRAVVESIVQRIFFRLLDNDGPFTEEELHSIIGGVLGRAYTVEGRLLLWHRYEGLSDLLHFIGTAENTRALAVHLKNYGDPIRR